MADHNHKSTRRQVLKAGAGLALLTGSTTIGAADTGSAERSAEEAGILEEIYWLLSRGKHDKAEYYLSEYNVSHDRDTVDESIIITSSGERVDIEEDSVGTLAQVNKQKTSLDLEAVHAYGNTYAVSYAIDLFEDSGPECASPKDAIAVSWSPDLWEYSPDSVLLGEHMSDPDDNPPGIKIDFDVQDELNDEAYDQERVSTLVNVQKTESGTHNIYGHYSHTWRPFCLPGGVSFGIGKGILSVSVSGRTDYWKKPAPTIEV